MVGYTHQMKEATAMANHKTAPEIIGMHIMCDIREVSAGRYQRYTAPSIYVCGNDYFCAPSGSQKPPAKDFNPWVEVGEYYGRKVYRSKS